MSRLFLPALMALIGAVVLIRTAAEGGLGMTIGTLVGVALLGIGIGRLYITQTSKGGAGS